MNVGLIGYGFMGGAHAAAIQSLPGMTLYALAARTPPSVNAPTRGNLHVKTAPLPDSVHWTPDWREVVSNPAIHAIDICAPTHLHREIVLAALQNGKHVLCEKPMAMNASECEGLVAAATQAGKTFMIAQVLRFMYPYIYALDFIRQAGAENITSCVLQRSTGYPQWSAWLADNDRSGGAILDLLSHDLDQALLWFGQPDSVSAVSIGKIDTAEATLHYGHRKVIVTGGWLAPEAPFSASFQIATADHALAYNGELLALTRRGSTTNIEIPKHDPYADEITYFFNCVTRGAFPQRCPPADSARVVLLADILKRSREEQRRETS